MKNILVPIDFSDVMHSVIEKASEIALAFTCKLWLIHVAAPNPEFVGYDIGPQYVRDRRARTLRDEHKTIQKEAHNLEKKGIEVESLLIQGVIVDSILAESEKVKADLIVLGSHGHGALYRMLMGSVCEGILGKASCPLLIIPSPTI